MVDAIPDLWPDEVEADAVLSPLAIMRHQAGLLRHRTKNLLEAEINSHSDDEGVVTHEFVVIAPALDRYTYSIFRAKHDENFVYPVSVKAECFKGVTFAGNRGDSASTDTEFLGLVKNVLYSGEVKAVILSLLARINDRVNEKST